MGPGPADLPEPRRLTPPLLLARWIGRDDDDGVDSDWDDENDDDDFDDDDDEEISMGLGRSSVFVSQKTYL